MLYIADSLNREFGKIQNYAKIIVHMEIANKKFVKILFAITAISFLWFGTFDSMHQALPVVLGDAQAKQDPVVDIGAADDLGAAVNLVQTAASEP